jgi:hypothetical protein
MTEEERLREARAAVPPGRYKHFKGNTYQVIGVAFDTATGIPLVIYHRPETPAELFARAKEDFVENVQRGDYAGPRFTREEQP